MSRWMLQTMPTSMMEKVRNGIIILLTLTIIVLMIGNIYYLGIINEGIETESWTPVEGMITGTSIQTTGLDSINYHPIVRYKYTIGETTYTSRRIGIWLNDFFPSQNEANFYIQRYPVGKIVPVYVHPDNFNKSVLEPGVDSRTLARFMDYKTIATVALILLCGIGLTTNNLSLKKFWKKRISNERRDSSQQPTMKNSLRKKFKELRTKTDSSIELPYNVILGCTVILIGLPIALLIFDYYNVGSKTDKHVVLVVFYILSFLISVLLLHYVGNMVKTLKTEPFPAMLAFVLIIPLFALSIMIIMIVVIFVIMVFVVIMVGLFILCLGAMSLVLGLGIYFILEIIYSLITFSSVPVELISPLFLFSLIIPFSAFLLGLVLFGVSLIGFAIKEFKTKTNGSNRKNNKLIPPQTQTKPFNLFPNSKISLNLNEVLIYSFVVVMIVFFLVTIYDVLEYYPPRSGYNFERNLNLLISVVYFICIWQPVIAIYLSLFLIQTKRNKTEFNIRTGSILSWIVLNLIFILYSFNLITIGDIVGIFSSILFLAISISINFVLYKSLERNLSINLISKIKSKVLVTHEDK